MVIIRFNEEIFANLHFCIFAFLNLIKYTITYYKKFIKCK